MNPKDFGKVAVLMGGPSAEREISLLSGQAVLASLRRSGVDAHGFDPAERELADIKRFDRAFVILHGRGGEDGTVQGALELMGVPYTGSGVLASALAMDKWRTKLVWQAAGVPIADYLLLDAGSDLVAATAHLGLPMFVKPANEGSSIGITKVKRAADLAEAYDVAARYDELVIAERFIDGAEVQFPILGERVLPSIRIEPAGEFYDYDAKYFRDDTRYHCPGLPAEQEARLHASVLHAFRVLGCRGWGRMDLIVDRAGRPFFLEMNTVPGMTSHSLMPMGAKAAGIGFDALVLQILETSQDAGARPAPGGRHAAG
ncbi:MAG: D-alanine--D-alanine ligase [Gammaproteobacteria bacterium]|nr:D-alanine--D-alanine ligase [Gammaproteobacteria bacterium]